ncbi:uncharacterized protein LOC122083285 [Macadamia integrifolia]|uniref:uncharacterized protein LOC122083285 n=1 Tax=Macadamia integrifolia TaxID=60698 RepID=UPI001C4FFA6F|nr:uncharacterized protein LOC122083285 [Macadamia integrifolia]
MKTQRAFFFSFYKQSDMKLKLLQWLFLIILCLQAFLGLAHEITLTHTYTADSKLLGQTGGEKAQPHDSKNVKIGLEEVKLLPVSGHKGKGNGAYGGGDINPRPTKTNGKSDASTLLARPSSIISLGLVQVIIIRLLVVFHILF